MTAPDASASTPAHRAGATSTQLLTRSVLIGLTPLIPIPIVDDMVKEYLERRMCEEIAVQHVQMLSPEELKLVAHGPGESILRSAARNIVTLPIRFLFRKIFFVLEVKRAADAASESYHRGYLLHVALHHRALAPKGPRTPAELRAAVDATLREVTFSPVTAAVNGVFDGSKALVTQALESLLSAIKKRGRAVTEESVAGAVDDAPESGGAVAPLVDRMKAAIVSVPEEYFTDLEGRFERHLGVDLTGAGGGSRQLGA